VLYANKYIAAEIIRGNKKVVYFQTFKQMPFKIIKLNSCFLLIGKCDMADKFSQLFCCFFFRITLFKYHN
jgi:hypothetical protein